MYKTLKEQELEKHPDKTLIGKTDRGFNFLGYHFKPKGIVSREKLELMDEDNHYLYLSDFLICSIISSKDASSSISTQCTDSF